jgi:hypothetical protein
MNIRKIIKEEIDDFGWAKETPSVKNIKNPMKGEEYFWIGKGEITIVSSDDTINMTFNDDESKEVGFVTKDRWVKMVNRGSIIHSRGVQYR